MHGPIDEATEEKAVVVYAHDAKSAAEQYAEDNDEEGCFTGGDPVIFVWNDSGKHAFSVFRELVVTYQARSTYHHKLANKPAATPERDWYLTLYEWRSFWVAQDVGGGCWLSRDLMTLGPHGRWYGECAESIDPTWLLVLKLPVPAPGQHYKAELQDGEWHVYSR